MIWLIIIPLIGWVAWSERRINRISEAITKISVGADERVGLLQSQINELKRVVEKESKKNHAEFVAVADIIEPLRMERDYKEKPSQNNNHE